MRIILCVIGLGCTLWSTLVGADEGRELRRTTQAYVLPRVLLTREDGARVALPAEIDDGRPVLLNFIYTSCTTICPLSSQVFAQFQQGLGAHERAQVHLISISIDPEQDTPARLREYARQFHAHRGWNHYTGSVEAVGEVQRAFDAYRGDKMSHTPLTFMRRAPGQPWVRIDGFSTVEDLRAETQAWGARLVAR